MTRPSDRVLVGVGCLLAGAVIVLIASGDIPVSDEDIHAPRWVLGLAGAVFSAFGLVVLVPSEGRPATWLAGAIVVSMTIIFGWVALIGESEHFSGDWPFLSRGANVLIARIVIGCVSLLGFAIIVGAAMKTWRKRER